MNYQLARPTRGQLQELIDIRLEAMRPSLVAIDRYDPQVAATRFSKEYDPEITTCILVSGKTVGFYVLAPMHDHLLLDHLYIRPVNQRQGIGTSIIRSIKVLSRTRQLPVKLGALRGSESNDLYQRHGFVKTHESEFDIYYQFTPDSHPDGITTMAEE